MVQRLICLLPLICLMAACQPETTDTHTPATAETAGAPVSALADPVQVIDGVIVVQMTGNDRMRFNVERFTAAPGQPIRLTLKNIGKMPANAMAHNFVLLQPGTNLNAFAGAAALEKTNDYIPEAYREQIIVFTAMLGPEESDTIEFSAPEASGEYPFLCSFPAHLFAGMKGVLVVDAPAVD